MDLDFTKTTKPSIEQVRFVWNQMIEPSCRKVAAEMQKRGAKICFKTVQRYHRNNWVKPAKGKGKQQMPLQKSAERKSNKVNNEARAKAAEMTGAQAEMANSADIDRAVGPLTTEEKSLFEATVIELFAKEQPDLVAKAKKAHLVYMIMTLETAAKRPDLMILVAADAARLLKSSTEAIHHMSGEPDPEPAKKLHAGNGHDMIDVTPNSNPVSQAIAAFKRRQGAAA